jgi:mRNA deadenylase 3'-5' endonuclease subunit Ccr4
MRMVKDKPDDGIIRKLINKLNSIFWQPIIALLIDWKLIRPAPEDPFKVSSTRMNQMISMKLAPKGGNEKDAFVVGTYHMPCMFQLPSVMMIHCALSAQHIARYSRGLPYIFCGDYNIKPDSRMYELFSAGRILDEKCDESPLRFTHPNDPWRAVLQQPLVSAYAVANRAQGGTSDEFNDHRGEPEFTNNAVNRNNPPFTETLDYIWLGNAFAAKTEATEAESDDRVWKLQSVLPLKRKSEVQGSYPAHGEPSDHVLLSANLELISKGKMV